MPTKLRIATFNLEDFGDTKSEEIDRLRAKPTLEERITVMRPQLIRFNADILCLQEVNGQEEQNYPRRLLALEKLISGTQYEKYSKVSTQLEDGQVYEKRNLVILSYYKIIDHRQYKHDLAPAPCYTPVTGNVKEGEYLFCWDDIPGNDKEKLIGFLKKKFDIEWAENAKIEKIDDGKTIRLSFENNFLSLKLNDEKTKLCLKIDDGRTDEFIAKTEKGKLNIYEEENKQIKVTWERPILHARIKLGEKTLEVINLHLKSRIPTDIEGQKLNYYKWKTAYGWAEGSFISSMKRVGQSLETRMLIDKLFEDDEEALIVVSGDFNAEYDEVPIEAIRGDVENTCNEQLIKRVMVPCELTIPESARYSLLHRGGKRMLDHLLISRSLLTYYTGSEIQNEILHDESIAFSTDVLFPESDHAPVIAEFELK